MSYYIIHVNNVRYELETSHRLHVSELELLYGEYSHMDYSPQQSNFSAPFGPNWPIWAQNSNILSCTISARVLHLELSNLKPNMYGILYHELWILRKIGPNLGPIGPETWKSFPAWFQPEFGIESFQIWTLASILATLSQILIFS